VAVIREGLERVVAAGVPAEAAETFLMGHLQIGIALIFEQFDCGCPRGPSWRSTGPGGSSSATTGTRSSSPSR